ncbi:MAG: hypothetical protein HY268_03180 [Deltaproteobacteria bacterium]|nr:hypothetical protein [Deltaproteobacteria bacterium]
MARTTRRVQDCLPSGFSSEDLKTAKWFLDAVAPLYHGALHSHAAAIAVHDAKGGRTLTSLSALFHEEWPHVSLVEILTALANVGFITPPQRTAGSATNEESGGYSFRLTGEQCQLPRLAPRGGRTRLRSGQKARGIGQRRHLKVG